MENVLYTGTKVGFITQEDGIIHHGKYDFNKTFARRFIDETGEYTSPQIRIWWEEMENMTDAVNITIGNIVSMIERIAETEYRRGYADALKEKELTDKHWKQADIMDLLHDSWQERIKEREDKTEKPEKSCETCEYQYECNPFSCVNYDLYKAREGKTK